MNWEFGKELWSLYYERSVVPKFEALNGSIALNFV